FKIPKLSGFELATIRALFARRTEHAARGPRRDYRTRTSGRDDPGRRSQAHHRARQGPAAAAQANEAAGRATAATRRHWPGERARLRDRVEELQAEKRRLQIKIGALESEVEEAKAAAKPPPESKPASRCSICHEKKQVVLRPVFICDNCVDIYEVREAAPPDD